MPFLDGYDATIKIREYLYQMRIDQPIISAVTGHTEQTYINKCFTSGMNMVLSKPINHKILESILQKLEFI